jgi:hypothetical protein
LFRRIGKLGEKTPNAVTKRIEHLPVMLIERPVPFLLTDVLTYSLQAGVRLPWPFVAFAWLTTSYGSGQPAIFSKWFMHMVLRHGSRGRICLVPSGSQAQLCPLGGLDDAR